jgi:chromosome partitioning protein
VAIYDARSRGTQAYFELAGEFAARNGIEIPRKQDLASDAPGAKVSVQPKS